MDYCKSTVKDEGFCRCQWEVDSSMREERMLDRAKFLCGDRKTRQYPCLPCPQVDSRSNG